MFDTKKHINRYGEMTIDLTDTAQDERTVLLAKALSHPLRLKLLRQILRIPKTVTELAKLNHITNSTVIFHLNILQEADLVITKTKPNKKGKTLVFYVNFSRITFLLDNTPEKERESVLTQSVGVGCYTSAFPTDYIRIATEDRFIVLEKEDAYNPQRFNAKLLGIGNGEVSYTFSNAFAKHNTVKKLSFSMELSSESPYHCNDWKSEIIFAVCGTDLAIYLAPGDYGNIRGKLSPDWWNNKYSQYGDMVTLSIDHEGVCLNDTRIRTDVTLETLPLKESDHITLSLRTDPSLRYAGGFNIYGSRFGNHPQDIVMSAVLTR